MTDRPADLPDYRDPPIDEVVISVQFPPIEGFFDTHAGLYWQRVRQDYPRSESQPRMEGPIETAEPGQLIPMSLQLTPGQGRVWLISADDDFLIQVQNTRFIQNWRRRQGEYQHFEQLSNLFWANYTKFLEFLTEEGLTKPAVQQVEVSYVNWIPEQATDFLRPASVAAVSVLGSNGYPDQQSWIARYSLESDRGLIQRLYVQSLPASRKDAPNVSGTQFALTYRAARADGIELSELSELIGSARITIVTAFTDLTTEDAHQRWGRFQ